MCRLSSWSTIHCSRFESSWVSQMSGIKPSGSSALAMPRSTGGTLTLVKSPTTTATVWLRPRFSPLAMTSR